MYGLGKGLALKKDNEFRECAAVFCDSDSNAVDDINMVKTLWSFYSERISKKTWIP